MAYFMTSASLIRSVKRRASVPDSQSFISDEEILDFANEEMFLNLIPLVLSHHQDYYLVREEVALVADQVRYTIPYRAIGSHLREVAYADSYGNLREMHRISTDDVVHDGYTINGNNQFYIEGEEVVLHTDSSQVPSGYLVFFYNLRPNSLVDSDQVGVISNIDRNTGIITLQSTPTAFASGSLYDFVQTKSPHRIISFDISATNVDSVTNTITFTASDIPSKLVVGDRIAIAGETDLINAPSDLHVMLAQMIASRVLESIGDLNNLKAANAKLEKMESNSSKLISNRVSGSPYKVRVRNGLIRSSNLGSKRGGRHNGNN